MKMIRHICNNIFKKASLMQQRLQQNCCYHSEKGVFGYRPRISKKYKVPENVLQSRNAQGNVYRWVEAYRKYGHKLAAVNPISIKSQQRSLDELNPAFYGLQSQDNVHPQGLLNVPNFADTATMTVGELETKLKEIYCGKAVSAEFGYIENLEEREWLATHFEHLNTKLRQNLSKENRKQIAELLIKSQAWNYFMAKKFPSVKRYGGEGAESSMAFFWQLLRSCAQDNVKHIVAGMPHRGRTELLAILLNMRPAKVFRNLRGESEFPDDCEAMSDIISHFHISEDLSVEGKNIHLSMTRNPSHLEAVNPVAMGKTRSKQQALKDGAFNDIEEQLFGTSVLNILLHGDAAFAGQGVNQECLNMAYVPHFEIGGSIHLIINNQIGFTTPGDRGRSTDYCTDLAKTIQAPVFHVNGDDPEMVALVTQLAFEYQRQFRKDIFIDMNCYRRWGHNELDDPTFTNPLIYAIINNRKSVPDLYVETLNKQSVLSTEEAQKVHTDYTDYLNEELLLAPSYKPEPSYFQKQWQFITTASDNITYWDTGLDYGLLHYIGQQSVAYPDSFNIHAHLKKTHVESRIKKLSVGEKIDWSTAEALAIGSLMYQGYNVRLSGEDVGRGTFSHRHVMLVDQVTNEMFIPLNDLRGGHDGKLEVAQSILSEEAVLGYEYGMAIDNPNNLIIWEAQFGDFANGAQVVIDNFIVSGETKWMNSNGLVLLLPHGYDGAASEHSSCRIERFLQLCNSKECAADGDNVNVQIINPTTPAQYFHALRRQQVRNFRKPLVVVAPKILLRLSAATSLHTDFAPGTYFLNVISDNTVDQSAVKRIIFCSGKHYYNLADEKHAQHAEDTAIIRVESLCPFPAYELQQEIAKYKSAQKFVWSQEEPRNMGAWSFVRPRFENLVGKKLEYCGRTEAATSATGIGKVHKLEVEEIVKKPFKI